MGRRQVERRGLQATEINCPSCGHVNDTAHKFCGMCGARTDRRAVSERRSSAQDQSPATAVSNAQLPGPQTANRGAEALLHQPDGPSPAGTTARAVEIEPHAKTAPAIVRNVTRAPAAPRLTGPSFLGLSDDGPSDPEYLLREEPSSRGILRKLVLIAILAAIGGLAYKGWRSGTFSLNTKPQSKPSDRVAPSPGASPQAPVADSSQDSAPKPASNSSATPGDPSAPNNASPKETLGAPSKSGGTDAEKVDAKTADEPKAATATAAQATGMPVSGKKPNAALQKAQRYLQGRGVRQNCEQGLVYLRAATQENDPGAAVQMGALYASGHCVQQDRVMAYRWLNSAHELDPRNQWIEADLEQLWARMTPQERQRAGP